MSFRPRTVLVPLIAALSGAVLLAAPALADPVTWTANTTHNGLPVTGTFTIDVNTRAVAAVNLTHNGVTYTGGTLRAGTDNLFFSYVPSGGASQLNQPALAFAVAPNFTNAGGTVGISVTGLGTCSNATCDSVSVTTDSAGGRSLNGIGITPVPTMAEWAMILFGLILAGGAALHLQRRRLIA